MPQESLVPDEPTEYDVKIDLDKAIDVPKPAEKVEPRRGYTV